MNNKKNIVEVVNELKLMAKEYDSLKSFIYDLSEKEYFVGMNGKLSFMLYNDLDNIYEFTHVLQYGNENVILQYRSDDVNALHNYNCEEDKGRKDLFYVYHGKLDYCMLNGVFNLKITFIE